MALQQKLDAAGKGASYTYHANGTLATRTWARGVVAAYTHNALGELTGISYSGEPAGQQTPAVSLLRDAKGRLATVGGGYDFREYQWRADGRLEREVSPLGTLLYGYDAAGRRTGYAFADGAAGYATWGGWGYETETGRLSGVSTPEGWIAQSYDPATGAPLAWGGGGYAESYARDGLGRVVSVTGSAVGIAGHDADVTRTYAYNGKGQRETLAEESGETWHFDYNQRGEVKEGKKKLVAAALPGMKRGYQYDAIGNRTELKVNGLDNNWLANALNQIESRNVEGMVHVTGKAASAPAQVTVAAEADEIPYKPSVTPVGAGAGESF